MIRLLELKEVVIEGLLADADFLSRHLESNFLVVVELAPLRYLDHNLSDLSFFLPPAALSKVALSLLELERIHVFA